MPTSAVNDALIPVKKAFLSIALQGIVSHNSDSSTLPMSWIIFCEFSLNGLKALLCCRIGLKILSMSDSRSSSRAHEHELSALFHKLHVAIQTPWSRCLSPRAGRTSVHQRVAPFWLDLHQRFCLCLCLSLKRSTNKSVFLQSRAKRVSISWALERDVLFCHNGSLPVQKNWIRIWLGWLVAFCLSSNLWTHFLHPIISQGKSSEAVEVIHILLCIWFSPVSHPDSFRDTISWECIVNNDGVSIAFWWNFNPFFWASLMSTQYTVFWCFLPCCMHVPVQDAVLPSRSSQDLCVLSP